MKPKDIFQIDNPLNIVLWLLVSLSTFLFGLFGQTANLLLEKLTKTNIPKEILLAGFLLSLAAIPLLVGLLIVLWNENHALKQQPTWYTAFGAKWKYLPRQKQFDPWPYCRCCPSAPKALSFKGMNQEFHAEFLVCPTREVDHQELARSRFMLVDTTNRKEEFLSVIDSLARIKKEVLHV